MPDFFEQVEQDAAAAGHGITGLFRHHRAAQAATQTPAAVPVNLAAATAAAAPKGTPMSLAQDIETGWTDARNGVAKFEQTILPAALARVRQFEGSPFAAIAEKAAASILPPEAVSVAVSTAEKVIDEMIALYAPAQAAQPQQQPAAAAVPA